MQGRDQLASRCTATLWPTGSMGAQSLLFPLVAEAGNPHLSPTPVCSSPKGQHGANAKAVLSRPSSTSGPDSPGERPSLRV